MSPPLLLKTIMGKWLLIKPEPVHIRGICITCNNRPQRNKGNSKYAAECQKCHDARSNKNYGKRLRHRNRLKGSNLVCDQCGFVAQHICQIDLDHIDGNHSNDASDNLQNICANCHRLKTYLNKDWEYKT